MDSWSLPSIPTWLVVTTGVVFLIYKYCVWHFGVFKRLGIKGPTPYPAVGTMGPMMKVGLMKHDLELKKEYGSVVGTFMGRLPNLMIYDPEMLKQILVKDFSNFSNRYDPNIHDYPLEKMVVFLKDEHWKHVRNHLAPTFSSGKLRKMNGKMMHCVDTFLKNLERNADKKEIFDFRELSGAFTMDVIASTAFGLQIDSHNDPKNQFVKMAKKAFDFNFTKLSTLLFFFFPFLIKPLGRIGLPIFPKDVVDFFSAAVNRAMSERKDANSDNMDFLQLMINAEAEDEVKKQTNGEVRSSTEDGWNKSKGLTHDEVLAQGIVFFLAGYETTANTLALFGYQLAVNPDVQERLIKEIDDVMKDEKHVTYDLVQKMPYLEMCLSEILRLYPAGPRTDRVTKCDVVINGLFIPKGMIVVVPIYAIQNDPEFWTNPEKFDPERFAPEAKESITPFTFMPFGLGPRNCVGMRLALMELKMSMVHILQRLKFVVCEKTQIPLQLEKLKMQGVDGIKLKVEKR